MIFDKDNTFKFMKSATKEELTSIPLPVDKLGEHMPILLVEDDRLCAVVVCQSLTTLGHQIDWAESAELALDKIGQNSYSVVLANIVLPGQSGIEMTAKVRKLKDKQKATVPIIAYTGHTSEEKKKLCMDAGMQGVLHKPCTTEELKEALHGFVRNGSKGNKIQ